MTEERTETDESPEAMDAGRAESMLDKLRAALDELRVQAELGTADVRDRLEPRIDALRLRQWEARRALLDAKDAGSDAWKTAASRAGGAVDELGDAFFTIAEEVQHAATTAGSAVTGARDAFLEEWRRHRAGRTAG